MGLLTETKIIRMKVAGTPQVKADGEGLYLRVSAKGYKTWAFHYTDDHGKRKWHHLGAYSEDNNLETARKKRNEVIGLLEQEIDPNGERARRKQERLQAPTVADLVKDFLENYARKNRSSWEEDQRILEREVVPAWGDRKAKEITGRDVAILYKNIGERAPVLANRTRSLMHLMFGLAVEDEAIPNNPVASIRKRYKEETRDRFLTAEEIHTFWHGLNAEDTPVSDVVRGALRLVLATACRSGEAVSLWWHNIESGEEWWNLPSPDSKTDNGHRIYLNATAREIIGKRPDGGGPVFRSRVEDRDSITVRSLTKVLRRAGHFGLDPFTSHDLRRTTATHLGELGYDDFIIGVILTHKRRGVTKIYNRYRYDSQKREAMDRWDERLREILRGPILCGSNPAQVGSCILSR